ncbi:MAG: hypothetical protein ACE14S_03650 [Candidatus Bathyarchaeia archaeon]
MSNSQKPLYVAIVLIALVVVALAAFYFSGLFDSMLRLSTAEITLLFGVVNGAATIVLAAVATMNGLEAKKVRSEMVRPRLALEPLYFEYDTKTGEIIGFTCLNLVNGGTVARDVEIDFCYKDKCTALYASSVGTNDRVQIWNGQFSELGGNITVAIKYKNMFNKNLQEVLSINIDSIKQAKRKFVPVLNPGSS